MTAREIEKLTPSDIRRVLVKHGIRPRSGSWRDYERAKRIIFENMVIDGRKYEETISIITNYLNV